MTAELPYNQNQQNTIGVKPPTPLHTVPHRTAFAPAAPAARSDTALSAEQSRADFLRAGFRQPRMAALCGRVTPIDQVAFTTFRMPRMAALCLQMTLDDQVAFTTFRKQMMGALSLQMTLQSHTCSTHTDSRSRNHNWTRWKIPNPEICMISFGTRTFV